MRRAGLRANARAVELFRAAHAEIFVRQKALPVDEVVVGEVEPQRNVTQKRVRRVARQNVDLAAGKRGEALLGGQRHEAHFARIAEHNGGDGVAEIGVDALHPPAVVGRGKARQAAVNAASDIAFGFDIVQCAGLRDARRAQSGRGQQGEKFVGLFHWWLIPPLVQ